MEDGFYQNGRSLEKYVEAYLELYHESNLSEETLKYYFWSGMDDTLGAMLLLDVEQFSFVQFLDRALWVCGSSLTVGVTEEISCGPKLVHSAKTVPSNPKPRSHKRIPNRALKKPARHIRTTESIHRLCTGELAHRSCPFEHVLRTGPVVPAIQSCRVK